jgi:hypothetical protein
MKIHAVREIHVEALLYRADDDVFAGLGLASSG